MKAIVKYPRTPHIEGSRSQPGDEDVKIVPAGDLRGRPLVVEEKLDGSNSAISFESDGTLVLQSRGHVLTGGPRERQFDLFKRWSSWHRDALWRILGPRYIMYGEWLYARHTIAYDELPHYFLEFDVLDREAGEFLDTERRHKLLAGSPVMSAPVLATGSVKTFEGLIGRSRCSSSESMEGLYIKWEEGGQVRERYKYVRGSFLQAVADSEEHWMDRPIVPNRLRAGVDVFQS
ncbi:MAG: RNA ligase family protein [Acidobacteriia bacterium]|nr:RNA ligase family protein [Terriglobia bacterium]